jgi:Neuraminidase (sialidase)
VQARLQDRAFCARTDDGGKTVKFVSWITDSVTVHSVMPSTVQLSENHLITALRRRWDEFFTDKPRLAHNWIDVYESRDGGKTWHFLSKVADTDHGGDNGNPPSLVLMLDGRLVGTYGFRGVPYGIRAKISSDSGKTWSKEIMLRDDAITWDIGYTRSVQRSDGKVVTIYYYSTKERKEQHIEATIWDPDVVE